MQAGLKQPNLIGYSSPLKRYLRDPIIIRD